MVKRSISALLWLVAVGWAWNFISAYLGAPQLIGAVLAPAVALFIAVDPLHVAWTESRASTPPQGVSLPPAIERLATRP